jgi:hypothetical protein
MKSFRKHLLTSIAALGLGVAAVAAHANKPECEDMGQRHHMSAADHEKFAQRFKERMAKREAELHAGLKLNQAQESGWKNYIGKMQPASRAARPDRAEFDKLPAPERMEKMLASMKEREAGMAQRVAATREFYATLTPEQQKVFDEASRFGPRHHGQKRH